MVLYLLALLVGLAFATLANTLADRVVGIDEPQRSALACRACGAALPAAGVLAVPELFRRRTCGACGASASVRGPVLQVTLGVLFPLLLAHLLALGGATRLPIAAIGVIDALALGVLAFIFAVDLEHHLIFDLSVYLLGAFLLAVAALFDHKALAAMAVGMVLSGGLFFLLYGLGWLLYRQEALGFGDVKLAALVGLLVGWPAINTALLLTVLMGAAISVLLLGLGSVDRRTYIPFGTFLALGATLTLLLAKPLW